MKFGCHGSTWELNYDKETDNLVEIMDVVQNTGFQGIDIQISLLGRFKQNPEQLKEELDNRGLGLAALTIPFSWNSQQETEEEIALSTYYIKFLKHFPGAIMNVAPRVGKNRNHLLQRQREIIKCANALGKRASDNGVICSFHPSSPPTSFFRTEADYEVLFAGLATEYIGYTPDAGHIVFGGMDVMKTFKNYMYAIRHVHIKDAVATPEWRKMGTGEVDFPEISRELVKVGYNGWIMFEEETKESVENPTKAIMDISDYVRNCIDSFR